jgi:hypothetical protein
MALIRTHAVRALALLALAMSSAQTSAGDSPAPNDAYLYIGWPTNGAVVARSFRIWFGLRNMGIAPAGVEMPLTGHHHLLIDAPLPAADEEIPSDRNHIHFGRGQTEAVLSLSPGQHTLQLLLGDHEHIAHSRPIVSKKITITVR